MSKFSEIMKDEALLALIRKSGDQRDFNGAYAAQHQIALALQEPLRQGILVGDVLDGIYEANVLAPGATAQYSLDLLAPGEESQHIAYTIPKSGYIPQRTVEGDYVMIPTYRIGNAIDWLLTFARDARYDVLGRAMEVLNAGFIKKINDDGWHTLLAAGADRNIVVYDADASAGQFTKRLVSLMKVLMVRNAGGNTGSVRRGKLTDLWLSHEAVEDIRNWGVDIVDDMTRREIFMSDTGITKLFGIMLHSIDELGEDQEYQNFFTSASGLGGSLAASDVELVVGLDLSTRDSFVMPIRQEVEIFPDPIIHREQKAGFYGWAEMGFAVLDGRRVLLGSL